MTKKLYYDDAYINEFSADVLSVTEEGCRYAVVLDRTAFFPEEGGQYADSGYIAGAPVSDVREIDGVIYHYTDEPVSVGASVHCSINFSERFSNMQCHSAEHILSGFFKRLYDLDNVGFHLGTHEVTMDINGALTREELDRVELLANEVVFANVPITAYFPSQEELSALSYRSKLDLTENVRIVKVGEYDTCACCAPHVASTGEIGLIKLLNFEKHKGGLRIYMAAGSRALDDYRDKLSNVQRISALLCEPQSTVADAVIRQLDETENLRRTLKNARMKIVAYEAEKIPVTSGNYVCFLDDMTSDELRELCNLAHSKVSGILLALSGKEGEYRYTACSDDPGFAETVRSANTALSGRGGGRGILAQGTFYTVKENIEKYFD